MSLALTPILDLANISRRAHRRSGRSREHGECEGYTVNPSLSLRSEAKHPPTIRALLGIAASPCGLPRNDRPLRSFFELRATSGGIVLESVWSAGLDPACSRCDRRDRRLISVTRIRPQSMPPARIVAIRVKVARPAIQAQSASACPWSLCRRSHAFRGWPRLQYVLGAAWGPRGEGLTRLTDADRA